jgi:hypothetical protein
VRHAVVSIGPCSNVYVEGVRHVSVVSRHAASTIPTSPAAWVGQTGLMSAEALPSSVPVACHAAGIGGLYFLGSEGECEAAPERATPVYLRST